MISLYLLSSGVQAVDFVAFVREGKQYILIDEKGNKLSSEPITKVMDFYKGYSRCVIDKKWYFIDQNGKVFTYSGEVDKLFAFSEGLGGFKTDDKCGFINNEGEVVIEPKFQDVKAFQDGVCWVKENNLWFMIDATGKPIIQERFNRFHYYSNGFARVRIGELWGYIDKQGKYLGAGCVYTDNNDFVDGVALAKKGELWGLLKDDGSWLVEPQYNRIWDHFKDGYALVRKGEQIGIMKPDGSELLPPVYRKIDEYNEGYFGVMQNSTWGVVDSTGKTIADGFTKFKGFHNGCAVITKDDKFGVLYPSGEVKLLGKYDVINDFVNGFAPVKKGDFWGFINLKGEEVVSTSYLSVKDFEGEWTIVKNTNDKWIYIDNSGKSMIGNEFDNADLFVRNKQADKDFSCESTLFLDTGFSSFIKTTRSWFMKEDMIPTDIARVKYNKEWAFINKDGEFILENLNNAEMWVNGYARFRKDGEWGVIDQNGNVVVEPIYQDITEMTEYCL